MKAIGDGDYKNGLNGIGELGVKALEEATPKDTGLTASSWKYSIKKTKKDIIISWYNTNIQNGVNIAAIIQYGHGTSSGIYIEGIDYINPALEPIFGKMVERCWKEVTRDAEY